MVTFRELEMYKNFDELAEDVIDLAKEILPDQLFCLSSISDTQQMILKLSQNDTAIPVEEGMVINLEDSLCSRVDFKNKQPLVYEDVKDGHALGAFEEKLEAANVRSYLGLPISFVNGERFGTLCAVNDEKSQFDAKSITLLQRIVRMFTYYLDLERFAYRDSLTDLYNRHFLTRFFEGNSKAGGAVFLLDLDGFKKVNDLYGHDTGDVVLKEVASKLQRFTADHPDALAIRLGGDEFLVCFTEPANAAELSERADGLLDSLSDWEADYPLSASIGIAQYVAGGDCNLKELLQQADQALYQSKKSREEPLYFLLSSKLSVLRSGDIG
ncbi:MULTISPECIES: sensor domain-containing diguanylate cyclase [unclassified Planococcus (in: firmicutes)]|uniref:sensor domain-containing diguanylate cyclase n=1 Tax=unclassified Planococcus (in: firmicutes) TaxID=2662419 RepID=UPI0020B3E07C|nr:MULTISPECIES: sensor domain-containing diguanylate cyclase [unclassified Planococcus (in: firmicutes)]